MLAFAATSCAFAVHSVHEALAGCDAQGDAGGFPCCAHWREVCAGVAGQECLTFGRKLAGVRPVVFWCHCGSLCWSVGIAVFFLVAVLVVVLVTLT